MSLRVLAEAIILQSIEDLWDERYRSESINFFTGKAFSSFAKIAGLSTGDKLRILGMVKDASRLNHNSRNHKDNSADRALSSPQALSAPPRSLASPVY